MCSDCIKERSRCKCVPIHLQPDTLAALEPRDLRAIIICPSNPFVSVEPILAVPGLRAAIRQSRARNLIKPRKVWSASLKKRRERLTGLRRLQPLTEFLAFEEHARLDR